MTEQEVKAQVIIGKDAEDFTDSDLGKVVLGMAKQDEADAVAKIASANPADVLAMTVAQVELRVALRFPGYLSELIQRGQETFQAYKQQKEGQ